MGIDAAKPMQWEELKRMLVEEYSPREEIQNLEQELWNITTKGSEINAYTARFNDLAVMCPALVTLEYKKIDAKRIAHQLTSIEIQVGFIAESPESGTNKRKFNGKNPIQSFEERQDVVTNYAATTTIPIQTRKYAGTFPCCTQCNRHHLGNRSWCSQCNHQRTCDCYNYMKDTLPIAAGAQHIQHKIKEQTLKHAMMEDEHVLSMVKLVISRRNVQREEVKEVRKSAFVIGSKEAI
uniref:Retrotransposon gag domain-containing protein n=1 Tax=Lactuca sativa TaxID=4236 RepID=A0A9R1VJA4_LACSA|nr:hypothetical protein LSAT_V11C500256250 [Lactuca sativa]